MAQETWTVRSLIRATQPAKTFWRLMRNISRGLDCPFQVGLLPIGRFYNRDRPVISQLRATQFCNSRFEQQRARAARRANGRNRHSCILAGAVYHSPVYCTASAYCSPPAHLYIMVPTYKPEPPTDWTKHHELMQKYFRDILQPTHAHMVPTNWTRHCGTNILARNANYYMMMKQFLSQIWCVSNNNQGSPQLLHNSSMNTQKIFGV